MLCFNREVALITGAGRGIGRAHALALAERGCRVALNEADDPASRAAAEDVAREIRAGSGAAEVVCGDVVNQADAIVGEVLSRFGRLDILINNAGVAGESLFGDTAPEVWRRISEVHYHGTVNMCRAAWPVLLRNGRGAIVNTASGAIFGNLSSSAYGSAKSAIAGFSRCLSFDAENTGLRVNCVLPMAITRMVDGIEDAKLIAALETYFQPSHVAAFVTWLVHPDTAVNGKLFHVGAGRASQVVYATAAVVDPGESSPDAWAAHAADLLREDGLEVVHSGPQAFSVELAAVAADAGTTMSVHTNWQSKD